MPGRLRDAGGERVGEHRRARRQRGEPGPQLAEQRRRVGQERPDRRGVGDHGLEGRRRLGDRLLQVGDRHARQRAERAVEGHEQVRLVSLPPARARPLNASSPCRKPPRSVCGRGQVARHRLAGRASSGTNAPIASLTSAPRPARPSLKPMVEAVTPRRVGGSNIDSTWSRSTVAPVWRSGTVAPSANVRRERPRSDREVLLPDRALQPDRERRVDRQRPDAPVELEPEHRDRLPVRRPLGLHAVDEPDERAAHVDLGAVGELAGVGDLHVQRVAGHERQAVVGVVGQEHRDDHHEHGQRADQDRVAEAAAVATGVHPPGPIR